MPLHNLILSVNAGSSSLKLSLFCSSPESHSSTDNPSPSNNIVSLLATASVSNIGSTHAKFSYKFFRSSTPNLQEKLPSSITDHNAAFKHFLQILSSDRDFVNSGYKIQNITHICHRIVHGGDFTESVIVSKHTYSRLEELSDLAPLHNNRALSIIKSSHDTLPQSKSIAFFDSAFHRTLPPEVYTYPISPDISRDKKLRKYGFHGISYAFILRSVAAYFNKTPHQTSLVALHLGSGASACAICNGESVDTSMGLTPLSGLPGATRSGDVDPSLIFHYTPNASDVGRMSHDRAKSMHVTEAENILNTQAGWKALTGTTDFSEIAASEEPSHRLAFDIFVDRIVNYVGAYFVQLGGQVDALVFSGGIGENSPQLRSAVVRRCACLGLDCISEPKNNAVQEGEDIVVDVGDGAHKMRILVCKTNEELEIARQCASEAGFWK